LLLYCITGNTGPAPVRDSNEWNYNIRKLFHICITFAEYLRNKKTPAEFPRVLYWMHIGRLFLFYCFDHYGATLRNHFGLERLKRVFAFALHKLIQHTKSVRANVQHRRIVC